MDMALTSRLQPDVLAEIEAILMPNIRPLYSKSDRRHSVTGVTEEKPTQPTSPSVQAQSDRTHRRPVSPDKKQHRVKRGHASHATSAGIITVTASSSSSATTHSPSSETVTKTPGESGMCAICWSEPALIVFVPCGHMAW